MKKYTLHLGILLGSATFLLGGCAPVLIAAGAVGGLAVTRDSFVAELEQPREELWQAALAEAGHQGLLKRVDEPQGRIDARVGKTDMVLTVEQVTPSTVRLVVRARKYLLPQMKAAQALGLGITARISENGENLQS